MARKNKSKRRNTKSKTRNQTRSSSGRYGHDRGETEKQAMATAINHRMASTGLPEKVAMKQDAGSVIGRLYITGKITQIQLDAATKWCQLSYNNSIAIGAAKQRSCCDIGPYGRSTETTANQVERESRWMREYREVRRAAFEATPLAQMILDGIISDDKDMPDFVGDLRLALNAIHNMHRNVKAA